MSRRPADWDAVVVGAGPAGALTALELARAGAAVLLLDRAAFPRWKVCGSCLSPGAQEVLADAGLGPALRALRPAPLHTLRLAGWGTRAHVPLGPSVAVSRAALDAAVARAAVEAGATFLAPARARLAGVEEEWRVLELEAEGRRNTVRARLLVAADGVGSPLLAEALGSRAPAPDPGARIGFGALFAAEISAHEPSCEPSYEPGCEPSYEPGVIHMAVAAGGYVGAVRLEDGTLDVSAALDPGDGPGVGAGGAVRPEARVASILAEAGFPALPAEPLAGWRGTPRLGRRVPTRGAHRLLAVGDAAGYVEPFTGEGMAWALAGARALTPIALEGIRAWRPGLVAAWDRAHDDTVGAAARLCRGVSRALRSPALSRVGLHVVRHVPGVAAPFVHRAARAPGVPAGPA
ncbi:MAG: oxidoreductase [Gemmatimonadota bacterium]